MDTMHWVIFKVQNFCELYKFSFDHKILFRDSMYHVHMHVQSNSRYVMHGHGFEFRIRKNLSRKIFGVHVCYINTYLHEFFEPNLVPLNFLMTMDYSPWVEKEIWLFLKVAISPKPKRPCPQKLVCMHVTSIPTCLNFLSRFRLIKFFDDHGLYIVHGRKGKFAVF